MLKTSRTSIEYLKDTFKIGSDTYEESREEAQTAWDMYHNRQWTESQKNVLEERGQPKETFNIVKLFTRMLIGYYSTVINKVQAQPVGMEDAITTAALNDVIDFIFRDNDFTNEGEKIKLAGLVAGMMAVYINVEPTGEEDEFGRPLNRITLEYVPEHEIIRDPMSKREDYTDARFIHRWKWLTEEGVIKVFGKRKLNKLTEYYNFTDTNDVDFEEHHPKTYYGQYKVHNMYLIVHTQVIDEKGQAWDIYWHDDLILYKKKITYREVKFNYRTVLTHTSDEPEYYGIFHDVLESQKAINQALIKFQLLVNSQKVVVEKNAVENMADFTNAVNRVTAVIPVMKIDGVRFENLSRDALEQYHVIDKAFDRIQRILGINDSFLGMAFASDSGRKVKLQQNASIIALRYFTGRLESFYKLLGWDIMNLAKQYMTASQVIRLADDYSGPRWFQLNQPKIVEQVDPQTGQVYADYIYEEVLDPASGEPMEDDEGNLIIAPVPEESTEIAFTNADIEVVTTAYNDEDEKNQLMLETVLAGNAGNMLAQVNPAGYFKAYSLSMQSVKTKHSPEIAKIYMDTAHMLEGNMQAEQESSAMAEGQSGQPGSGQLKLPQNTNEAPV